MSITRLELDEIEGFVVRAKAHTYVGAGEAVTPSRPGSHDLAYAEGPFAYLDSYVGGTDFLGEELVTRNGEPVWAMNYYGWITRPDLLDAAGAGAVIREALSAMYREGRFLGGFHHEGARGTYEDRSTGDVAHFTGREQIVIGGEVAYRLTYHGGLVRA